ncbi:phospho-N-acetylmuramoyl-pentapeptide-transferase [Tissierella sp.]|uniref:phospho-N-acetylmuramoyl-pentapeptide- transferase n=1 Tax=Tissierella sp. TaxID=41274 RepID=UPI0028643538|nr:phospho-N-acetylmuramoyl-pentapeptide-transferase [Tissierella sp.]MDR7856159.1 phospho-N-acetylmuramoyl-pentapeptide-transferase [Tissierella sp.]
MDYIGLICFFISLVLSYICLPMIKEMLLKSNIVCENFRDIKIPTSLGLVFVFVQVITLGSVEIMFNFSDNFNLIYLLGFSFIGMLGILDDLIGEKRVKGLRGHIKALFSGVLTTGGIKAILGLFISIIVSNYISVTFKDFIINSLIIGLFTNLINMFDLRPGRATKVFAIFALLFILSGFIREKSYIIYSLFGILIPYIRLDLKAMAMMGDVGSNVLGFTLGILAAISFTFEFRIIILILLIVFHVLAERISFSNIIDNNKVLKYFDSLGR